MRSIGGLVAVALFVPLAACAGQVIPTIPNVEPQPLCAPGSDCSELPQSCGGGTRCAEPEPTNSVPTEPPSVPSIHPTTTAEPPMPPPSSAEPPPSVPPTTEPPTTSGGDFVIEGSALAGTYSLRTGKPGDQLSCMGVYVYTTHYESGWPQKSFTIQLRGYDTISDGVTATYPSAEADKSVALSIVQQTADDGTYPSRYGGTGEIDGSCTATMAQWGRVAIVCENLVARGTHETFSVRGTMSCR